MTRAGLHQSIEVLQTPIDVLDWDTAIARIRLWAERRESRYVCFVNAYGLVTARRQAEFARVLRASDLNAPDGAPVAWMQRCLGGGAQQRIDGPNLMWRYCAEAARRREPLFLYGSTPQTLCLLQHNLLAAFPDLVIVGAHAPPFRPLSAAEDEAMVAQINASGAATVWVGLGCPLQEQWMFQHRGRIQATMLGVGAAFDFHAGNVRRAPLWWQTHGLE